MSDKRIKELLILWDDLVHCFLPIGTDAMLKEKLIEIRRRIEHGPEVSREFVEKYANRISIATTWNGQNVRILKRAFREAGVTVKEKK